jgi:uncharacterized repeat protein (TIGR02543 family)
MGRGIEVSEPADPAWPGGTFEGWYTALDVLWDFDDAVSSNMTLIAKWSVTVTFDPDNGDPTSEEKIDRDAKVSEPTDPVWPGGTFEGWYLGDDEWDFDDPVTSDMTLIAKWSVTVTFESNGGSPIASETVPRGSAISEPALPPVRSAHTFEGWFDALDVLWDFDGPVANNMTLYAKWTEDPVTVTFESNGGSATAPASVAIGDTIPAPAAPTRSGHTFDGWFADDGTVLIEWDCDTDTVPGDVTLYAKWTPNAKPVPTWSWVAIAFAGLVMLLIFLDDDDEEKEDKKKQQ